MRELEISRLERELDDYYYRLKDADKENARLHAELAAANARADEAENTRAELEALADARCMEKDFISDEARDLLARIDAALKGDSK